MIKKALFASSMLLASLFLAPAIGWTFTYSTKDFNLLPSSLWKGWYVGINAGGTWDQSDTIHVFSSLVPGTQSNVFPIGSTYLGNQAALASSGDIHTKGSGFLFGSHLGYNWLLTDCVITGLETDFEGIAAANNNRGRTVRIVPLTGAFADGSIFLPGNYVESTLSARKRVDYLGTFRAKLGLLTSQNFVISGTAGLAYGGATTRVSVLQHFNVPSSVVFPSGIFSQVASSEDIQNGTLVGWTVGANTDWMFKHNCSLRLEYLYYDLGSVTHALSSTEISTVFPGEEVAESRLATIASRASTQFNGHIVRLGLSYFFN